MHPKTQKGEPIPCEGRRRSTRQANSRGCSSRFQGGGAGIAETLATIERYSGYCKNGEDTEFYKSPSYLLALEEGPFYGNKSARPTFFTVLGGLRTNLEMQVCDEDDNPIPGLYNVGSMAGDLFAGNYNFMIEGHSYGMCLTLGYLTGKYIAENE